MEMASGREVAAAIYMKLLLITQKVDRNDAVLGFMHGWLSSFSEKFEHICVICLEKGKVDLPRNVRVFSLGKERYESGIKNYELWKRMNYTLRFYRHVWRMRKMYDGVFVHMNPEYVILGGLLWRMWGRKIVLWYNHTYGDWKTRLAMKIADIVCHTSPYACTAATKKSVRMPAGIDTRVFKIDSSVARIPNSILYLGRIAPLKGVHILVSASKRLVQDHVNFSLNILGESLPHHVDYKKLIGEEVKIPEEIIKSRPFSEWNVRFWEEAVSHQDVSNIFQKHELFVNLTPSGNYDKTVLEACGCGTIPIVSSKAFADILTPEFRFKEGSAEDLARVLLHNLARSPEERQKLGEKFSTYVRENHDLQLLARRIQELYGAK